LSFCQYSLRPVLAKKWGASTKVLRPLFDVVFDQMFYKGNDMNRLQGKRTLITGGTTGIGLETARQFLAEGARVAITGTNPANLAAAQESLGPEVLVISSDAGRVAD
jgi:NADPH:quinone reductase-like Zn-dependent oxidoreductase